MKRSSRDASQILLSVALEQGGYFTAKQAAEAGYNYPHLDYHVSCGNFVRIGHGLYRLPVLPFSEQDDFIRLSLWSRNRQEEPQAIVSHESALSVHDLGELLPRTVHLTVPPGFRKKPPRGCVLHRAVLALNEIEERMGFRVTTPLRTLLDVARGDVSQEQLEKAVGEALRRGMVRKGRLEAAIREVPGLKRLSTALDARESMAT